MTEEEYMNY
jgi:hypothetical protein